jgi:hypothetical protein
MQVVATHSQVELAVSTAIVSAHPAASTAVTPAADSMAAAVVVASTAVAVVADSTAAAAVVTAAVVDTGKPLG